MSKNPSRVVANNRTTVTALVLMPLTAGFGTECVVLHGRGKIQQLGTWGKCIEGY